MSEVCQSRCQAGSGFVCQAKRRAVGNPIQLVPDGGIELRMAVPMEVGPNGGVGAVVDEQTAVKANKEGWCVVVPDKYYALRFLQ